MQINLISLPEDEAQAALAAGLPNTFISIVASHPGELEEPDEFLRQAARLLKARGASTGHDRRVIAAKVLGLLLAESRRPLDVGDTPDPLSAFRELQRLAEHRLGANSRDDNDPINILKAALDDAVSYLTAARGT